MPRTHQSSPRVTCWLDVDVGHGAIGGYLTSFTKEGEIVAEDADRILYSNKAKDIPIVRGANAYIFDLRALKRWGLKEADVPPGSIVLNRQPTLWESFRSYFIGGMTLIFVQALLISGLLWQRARRKAAETKLTIANKQLEDDFADRKRAEATLRESEERFRLVADTAPVMIWMTGPDRKCEFLNQTWLDFVGHSAETEFATGWAESIHPEDFTRSLETYSQAFDCRRPFSMEYRLRRSDGEYRWVFDVGVPRLTADGVFAGYIGSMDVSDRKKAEEVLATVAGRLIEAQEEERHRIARELHDDIGQRLSLLTIDLEMMAQDPPDSVVEVSNRIHKHLKREQEIAGDIQAMSQLIAFVELG